MLNQALDAEKNADLKRSLMALAEESKSHDMLMLLSSKGGEM